MLVIRLQRKGRRNKPFYRIVVQEKDWAPSSKAIDIVGSYNPHVAKDGVVLKEDKIKQWLSRGAQPSATVHNMLVNVGIIDGPKMKSVQTKKKKQDEEKSEHKPSTPKEESKPNEEKPAEDQKPESPPKEEAKEESK